MMQRHSSRRSRLDQSVLVQRLNGAVGYDRIAGYFRSSLFEIAGEALASVAGPVRVICNSDIDPQDLATAASNSHFDFLMGSEAGFRSRNFQTWSYPSQMEPDCLGQTGGGPLC